MKQLARPIGIDLFAGAGGMSLGFEQAGFDVIAAVELDPIHASTHKFNFPLCKTIPKSVIGLSGAEIRKLAGIGSRKIDVVFGGAPCQGFSLIGQRALGDPRNALVKEFVRIVGELSPSFFVFENVKGLTLAKHKRFLDEVIEAFSGIGFKVKLPWRVLNSVNFGVPQDRHRLFLLGSKKNKPMLKYPTSLNYGDNAGGNNHELRSKLTCLDALSDLPEVEEFDNLIDNDSVETSKWGDPSDYASLMRCMNAKGWYWGDKRRWDSTVLTSSKRTKHTEISKRRFKKTIPGHVEPISRFFKLAREGVSNTLRAGTDSSRGAFTSPRPIHYSAPRCITVREMARLHGFPDWFRLHITKWHGARQIGNAVPPPLARSVATKILEAMGLKPTKPRKMIDLGDPILLSMDMSKAAKFWGVQVPIARRNMKNGLKKRKQEQIEKQLSTELAEVANG